MQHPTHCNMRAASTRRLKPACKSMRASGSAQVSGGSHIRSARWRCWSRLCAQPLAYPRDYAAGRAHASRRAAETALTSSAEQTTPVHQRGHRASFTDGGSVGQSRGDCRAHAATSPRGRTGHFRAEMQSLALGAAAGGNAVMPLDRAFGEPRKLADAAAARAECVGESEVARNQTPTSAKRPCLDTLRCPRDRVLDPRHVS